MNDIRLMSPRVFSRPPLQHGSNNTANTGRFFSRTCQSSGDIYHKPSTQMLHFGLISLDGRRVNLRKATDYDPLNLQISGAASHNLNNNTPAWRRLRSVLKELETPAGREKYFLASGDKSNTFLLRDVPGYPQGLVIKTPKTNNPGYINGIRHEAEILKNAGQKGVKGQRWEATVDFHGRLYLLTTYAGKGLGDKQWDSPMFHRAMKELLNWDEEKVVHLDLHRGNLTEDENGNIRLIDWERSITHEELELNGPPKTFEKIFFCPNYYLPMNIRLFESHALYGDWFDSLYSDYQQHKQVNEPAFDRKIHQQLATFLKASSSYHREYPLDPGETTAQVRLESAALAKVLAHPLPLVKALEASRIQLMFDVERDYYAFTYHNRSIREHLGWMWNAYLHLQRYETILQALDSVPANRLAEKKHALEGPEILEETKKAYLDYHHNVCNAYRYCVEDMLGQTLENVLPKRVRLRETNGRISDFTVNQHTRRYILQTIVNLPEVNTAQDLWEYLVKPPQDPLDLMARTRKAYNRNCDDPNKYDFAGRIFGVIRQDNLAPEERKIFDAVDAKLKPERRRMMTVPNKWEVRGRGITRSLADVLREELEKLSNHAVAEQLKLDEGASANVYLLHGIPGHPHNLIVKEHKALTPEKAMDLYREARYLRDSRRTSGVRRLVALLWVNGRYYLVTNYAGTSLKDVPWTNKLLKSSMKELLYWDDKGVIQRDLHKGNLLQNENGKVCLIDLEDTMYSDIDDNYLEPRIKFFATPAEFPVMNLRFFESHALYAGWYDTVYAQLKNKKEVDQEALARQVSDEFDMFLKASADYYRHYKCSYEAIDKYFKRNTYTFDGQIETMYMILKNPPPLVKAAEAMRIQVLFDIERDYHAFDEGRNNRSLREHWQWNAYQHARRYNALLDVLEALPVRELLERENIAAEDDRKDYFRYHRAMAKSYLHMAGNILVETVRKTYSRPFVFATLDGYGSFNQLWGTLSKEAVQSGKIYNPACDNPDKYDFAKLIVASILKQKDLTPKQRETLALAV